MHVLDLFSLENRVAVVTGGAGKYGRIFCEALSEAGARVGICSRDVDKCKRFAEELQSRTGSEAVGLGFDLFDPDAPARLLSEIAQIWDVPDVLVNNAVARPLQGKFYDASAEDWDHTMEANSRSLFLMCKTFGSAMSKRGRGSVINVASIYGVIAPDMRIYEGTAMGTEPDYPYTKGAMIHYTKYLASLYATRGVRFNCISPGGLFADQPEPFLSRYCAKVPMSRMANHDDTKGALLLLASDAGAYITGQNLVVDGGMSII